MKKLKKLLSIVLAVAMVMSLAVSVTATTDTTDTADTTTNTTTDASSTQYTITISNAEEGETYSAYKIFDVTYSNDNYSYTISTDNPFYTAISQACDDNGDSLYGYLTLTPSASDSNVYVVTYAVPDGGSDDAFTANLAAVIKSVLDADSAGNITADKSITATSSNNVLDVTDSGAGYYYVNTTVSSVVALTTTDPTVTITNKWSEPTVEKGVYNDAPADDPTVETAKGSYDTTGGTESGTVGDSDAEIGETVYYQTTISNIYGVSNLVLHDTMDSGLTFNNDVTMYVYTAYSNLSSFTAGTTYYTCENGVFEKVGEETSSPTDGTTYYTKTEVTSTNGGYSVLQSSDSGYTSEHSCTFEIKIEDIDGLKDSSEDTISVTNGSYLVVEYTATVNSNAVIYAGGTNQSNDNTTYVSYGEASYTTSDTTETYVYSVNIFKYTGDLGESYTALTGAEFEVYYTENEGTYYATISNGKITEWTETEGSANTITTDSNGFIYIEGLDADKTYYLVETKAPDGYNLLSDPIQFKIIGSDPTGEDSQGSVYIGNSASTYSYYDIKSSGSTINNVIPVENQSGSELPSTGGIGVTVFYVVGGILILAAAGVIVVSRKKIKK